MRHGTHRWAHSLMIGSVIVRIAWYRIASRVREDLEAASRVIDTRGHLEQSERDGR